nr:MAG: hypothetical protein H3Bulk40570_000002 [Mitovirus sp.]
MSNFLCFNQIRCTQHPTWLTGSWDPGREPKPSKHVLVFLAPLRVGLIGKCAIIHSTEKDFPDVTSNTFVSRLYLLVIDTYPPQRTHVGATTLFHLVRWAPLST